MRDFLIYGLYRLVGAVAGRLPPRVGYRVAAWAGWLLHWFSPKLRRVLTGNIRHAAGPEANEVEVRAMVHEACAHIAKGHYDLFRVGRLSADEIERMVQIEGWEILEQALARGRGVIIFSAHLGNVDLVMHLSVIRGIPATSPVLRLRPERLFQYARRLRESHGLKMIPSDEPMVALFRALKRGELVGLAADRTTTDNARRVRFFGSTTQLPDGAVRIALRTGACLLPAFALRRPDDSILVEIEPPLELSCTEDPEADIEDGMKKLVSVLERRIGEHPEQWLVAVPIWPASSQSSE